MLGATQTAFIGTVLAAATAANSVVANELTPIDEALSAGADENYLAVRCAGLYYSVYLFGGETQLGQHVADDLGARTELLMRLAVLQRVEQGTDANTASQQVMQETNRIADLYVERYLANYAARGLPFTPDPVWDVDMEICADAIGAERGQ